MNSAQSLANTVNRVAEEQFSSKLCSLPGRKVLFVDEAFFDQRLGYARTLDLFVGDGVAAQHSIIAVSLLSAESPELALSYTQDSNPINNFVFLARTGRSDTGRAIAKTVKNVTSRRKGAGFLILCVPVISKVIESALEDAGVKGDVLCEELGLGLLGIDGNLLTLDWPGVYRELWHEKDKGCLLACTNALMGLEAAAQLNFTSVRCVGENALNVADEIALRKKNESDMTAKKTPVKFESSTDINFGAFHLEDSENAGVDEIKKTNAVLLILDRSVDLITPMLNQWTYEGMLDEVFGMTNSIVEIDAGLLGEEAAKTYNATLFGEVKVQGKDIRRKRLTSDDPVLDDLRHLNFAVATKLLGSVASGLRSFYAARPSNNNSDLEEVKSYVKDLGTKAKEQTLVSMHTSLAEEISSKTFENERFRRRFELEKRMLDDTLDLGSFISFVHEGAAMQEDVTTILRLVALWSHTKSSLSKSVYQDIMSAIQDAYGIEWLPLLYIAEHSKLILTDDQKGQGLTFFNPLARRNRGNDLYSWLIANDYMKCVKEYEPEDEVQNEEAPYSGYIPVAAKLLQYGLNQQGFVETVNHRFARKTLTPNGERAFEFKTGKTRSWPKVFVVVVLGGTTRAELSAMRTLVKRSNPHADLIFAPTSIITGHSIFAELLPPNLTQAM